jgi:SAM-dependent methyltransferase
MNHLWPTIFLVSALFIVLLLLFWQVSNFLSMWLGAPAISSPKIDLWRGFAHKEKTFLDLGCGLGSVCLRSAPHFKHVYGIEFSPWYYLLARLRTRRIENVTIIYGNFFIVDWPKTDYVYCYLLPELLVKMKSKLAWSNATILCQSFPIKGWQPIETLEKGDRKLFVYEPSQNR